MVMWLRRAARAAIRTSARDVTDRAGRSTALVLAPHPDDETLGCGATILRKVAAGTQVTVAVLTDGSRSHRSEAIPPEQLAALRRAEMDEATARLGLGPGAVRWGGFLDGDLDRHEPEVTRFVAGLMDELSPAEVYVTSAWETHPDHAALGRAARAVIAGRPDVTLLEYPIWLWGGWPLRSGDRARSAFDAAALVLRRGARRVRSEGYLPGKLHALDAHATQLHRPTEVEPEADWPVLPPAVLAAASAADELFIPWRASRRAPAPSGQLEG